MRAIVSVALILLCVSCAEAADGSVALVSAGHQSCGTSGEAVLAELSRPQPHTVPAAKVPQQKLVELRFASAAEVVDTLQDLITAERRYRASFPHWSQEGTGPRPTGIGNDEASVEVVDPNSIRIVAAQGDTEAIPAIEELVRRLDVDVAQPQDPAAGARR